MSRLIAYKAIPIKEDDGTIIEPVTLDEVKLYGRIDIEDQDDVLQSLIISSRQRIESLCAIVLVKSIVQARYKQRCGGTRIELFYCNGIPFKQTEFDYDLDFYLDADEGELDIEGVPDCGQIKGIDGDYTIEISGEQDIELTYKAGFGEVGEWAKLAIKKDVIWHWSRLGDNVDTSISPESLAIISPYRVISETFF